MMAQHRDLPVALEVSQLNWMTRRSPANGSWPCQELLLRLNASIVPATGGTSTMMSLRSRGERSSRSRPPGCSQLSFM